MSRWKSWTISLLGLALCATVTFADPPPGMALVPAGYFVMGNDFERADAYVHGPIHDVYVDGFYMGEHEVTWAKWREVRDQAGGYDIVGVGDGRADDHPVQSVNWYDVVKWCNARSEQEGLGPCYWVVDPGQEPGSVVTNVYKVGVRDYVICKWEANGYRLPTEAEWEKAARGGADWNRFPWADAQTIDFSRANYYCEMGADNGDCVWNEELFISICPPKHSYDQGEVVAPGWGYHPDHFDDTYVESGTAPVGSFAPNDYGLHDMAGNVSEWCWDSPGCFNSQWGFPSYTGGIFGYYSSFNFFEYVMDLVHNPRGFEPCPDPDYGWYCRAIRGGSWTSIAMMCQVGERNFGRTTDRYNEFGFRVVRKASSQESHEAPKLRPIGNRFGCEGYEIYIKASAGLLDNSVYSFSATPLPAGAGFVDGVFSWTPLAGQAGTYEITFTVSHGTLESSETVTVSVAGANAWPLGMVRIPAGLFLMGDSLYDSYKEQRLVELPVHEVMVSEFYMDRYEVTKALWDEVAAWAINHGYSFDWPVYVQASDHPVQGSSWSDYVKWCNARSEMEGLEICYYTDASHSTVYRIGSLNNLRPSAVDWEANGYRLPTEAEWEKAARGGVNGARFAWNDVNVISFERANFVSDRFGLCALIPNVGYHPDYNMDPYYTSPVGSFKPNGYGLYDMCGSVSEYCWDKYTNDYYSISPAVDPRGPDQASSGYGHGRVTRGGGGQSRCRMSARETGDAGFRTVRVVRNVNQPPVLASLDDVVVNEGEEVSFTVTASDPDGDALSFSVEGLPSGAIFENGVFTWTPTDEQAGNYSVTFTVSDGELSDSDAITIIVIDRNMAPVVMEAEAMPFKSNGLQVGDCWALLGTGRIEQGVELPFDGIYDIQIDAYGTPEGDGPVMVLTVDGVQVSSFVVNTTDLAAYSVPVQMAGGSHALAVEFVNDNGPRDLMIDKVTVALEEPDVVRVMEAETMAFKSNGETWWGIWGLYGVGYVEEPMQVAEAGVYEVTVRAYGRYSSGEWPTMIMLVDGVEVSHVSVDSADWQEFTFRVALAAGERDLGVKFVNDNGPRDLFLDKLVVAKMPAEAVHFVEAENMDYKSSGGAWWGVWGLWGVGQVREPVQIAQAGAYDLVVRARGTYSAGWPLMVVSVDGVDVSSFNVNSTDWADYTVSTELSAGEHTVAIKFLNDYGPRDLILDHMAVVPADNVLRALEVERMPFKSNGDTWWGIWGLYGTGYVQDSLVVPASGTYAFSVRAYGSQAGGVWPLMELRVDQTPVAACTVGSADWAEYVAEVELTEGTHTVEAAFLNDGWVAPNDRNLYLDRVKISVVE